MAENPVLKLARLLGGVALMQGRLGHQVLGQMLVLGTHEVAIAGASALVAATTRQRSALGQIALRTAAPALAVRGLLNNQLQLLQERARRLERREAFVTRREIELKRGELRVAQRERLLETAAALAPALEAAAVPAGKPKRQRRPTARARAKAKTRSEREPQPEPKPKVKAEVKSKKQDAKKPAKPRRGRRPPKS